MIKQGTFKKQTLLSNISLGSIDQFESTHNLKEYLSKNSSPPQHILNYESSHQCTNYSTDSIYSSQMNGSILFNELYHPHPLVMCCSRAYSDHYGLILSPDDIWLLIAQGFSRHVELKSDEMKSLFISDDTIVENDKHSSTTDRRSKGKINISVLLEPYLIKRRLLSTQDDNDGDNEEEKGRSNVFNNINWEGVIDEIVTKIDSNVKNNHLVQMLECNFSTSGAVERVSSRVVLMSSLKNYFSYYNGFKCGLPSITLMGTIEDWTTLREKTLELNHYGLEFWTRALIPILDNFIETYSCQSDETLPQNLIEFWNSIARHYSMSGGKKVDGWINYFFPYDKNGSVSSCVSSFDLEKFKKGEYKVVESCSNFPAGISRVTVDLFNSPLQDVNSLDYLAGFMGYGYDDNIGGLKTRIGWLIAKSQQQQQPEL